jgi:allantoate deiminase
VHEDDRDAALLATVGKVSIHPDAANVIAGFVQLSLDVRASRDSVREEAVAELLEKASAIAQRRRIQLEIKRLMDQPTIPMDEELSAVLAGCVESAGFPARRIPSGAGHDAMVLGTRLPAAMLFLRSPGGISHHPDETVLLSDVNAALKVGILFLQALAVRPK